MPRSIGFASRRSWSLAVTLWVLGVGALSCQCGPSRFQSHDDGGVGGGGAAVGGGASGPGVDSGMGGGSVGVGGGMAASGGGDGVAQCDLVGDGGCSCLRVATLGFPGQWGNGSDVFADWLGQKALLGVDSLADATLTPAVLSQYQVIIVQDVSMESLGVSGKGHGIGRLYTSAEVSALQQWVTNGGGLATLIGYSSDSQERTNVNALLQPFGLSYDGTPILQGGGSNGVTHWANHPITEGITAIGFVNGYAVLGGGTLVGWEPTPGQWDVARALESGAGRVFVWGDEWITYNSEWTNRPEFQVRRFWLNILKWLTPTATCQVVVTIG